MGFFGNLFGGGDVEAPQLPQAPTFKSAEELLGSGISFGKEQTPIAYGARENALGILQDPARTTEFFQGFQPTSFEQALANQTFQNIMPDVERSIKQNLSLSGIASSPILAQQIGQARGSLGVDIGEILAQLGQQRGAGSLEAQLGIDPLAQIVGPVAEFGQQQDQLQQQVEFQRALAQFGINQQAAESNRQNKSQGISSFGTLLGGGAGFLLGGPAGAAIGAGLGGSAAGLFGGSQSPISLGDALALSQVFPGGGVGSGNIPGSGIFGSRFGGQTQSEVMGQDTRQFSSPTSVFR